MRVPHTDAAFRDFGAYERLLIAAQEIDRSHLSAAALHATIRLLDRRPTQRAVGDSLETPKG
jgi:hypothetical protein